MITKLHAREILDSRGTPTLEVDLYINEFMGRAAVPSGASVGSKEAIELRDGGKRYLGKGVQRAVAAVNKEIADAVTGKHFNQAELDNLLIKLDGTKNKSRLGANATLAVSIAFAKATATAQGIPLYKSFGEHYTMPRPMMNIINGGAHADNALDIQEFMIIPIGFAQFSEALRAGAEIFAHLKKILKSQGFSVNVGDEGGFAPNYSTSRQALDAIISAITAAGYKPGEEIAIALDVAASEFFQDQLYTIEGKLLNSDELIDYYSQLLNEYPIISIEDPISEFDEQGWRSITEKLGNNVQIVGDDLFVTNSEILKHGIEQNMANAILIKLNQIGTVTETLQTINLAKENGYAAIISHRSGETEDTTIAHLAVGTAVGQIKTGSLCRTDRTAKYNELLRIEEELS